MLTTGWRTLPSCYCFLYASYPQINTPILRISVAIRKGINTSFSLKDTSRPPCPFTVHGFNTAYTKQANE